MYQEEWTTFPISMTVCLFTVSMRGNKKSHRRRQRAVRPPGATCRSLLDGVLDLKFLWKKNHRWVIWIDSRFSTTRPDGHQVSKSRPEGINMNDGNELWVIYPSTSSSGVRSSHRGRRQSKLQAVHSAKRGQCGIMLLFRRTLTKMNSLRPREPSHLPALNRV